MIASQTGYVSPEIVCEGDLEIQAGSPLSRVSFDDEEWEWWPQEENDV